MSNNNTVKKTRKDFSQSGRGAAAAREPTAEDASLSQLLEQEQAHMAHLDELDDKARDSPHVRAVKLRARMRQYNSIYNSAWHVRAAQHGMPEYRAGKIADFVRVLRAELERSKDAMDQEALIYAVADALTSYPRGMPWDG